MEEKKTIVITKSNGVVSVDPSTLEVGEVTSEREAISRIFIVQEDCIIKYGNDTRNAEKGNIVVVFYEGLFPNKFVIVDCAEWLENLVAYNTKMTKNNKILEEACATYAAQIPDAQEECDNTQDA